LTGHSHFIAGINGGIVSTLACHPLGLLRVRYAANDGSLSRPQYKSYWDACRTIVRAQGIRGIYQGLTPNLIAAPLSFGLYFHIYHKIHANFANTSDPNKQFFLQNVLMGCFTGGIVLFVTNPLWVVKTRLCLQYENSTKQYSGMVDCFRKIYKFDGVRGLYKGFVPGLVGCGNGSIQFACYNFLKDYRRASLGLKFNDRLGAMDYLVFSSTAKMFSVLSTYPYQVIRTRLQDHNVKYKGLVDCVVQTWTREGIRGMYKGALMAAIKQTPAKVITFVVYENTKHFLDGF